MLRSHITLTAAQFNCYINDFNGLMKEFVTNLQENAWLAFIETQPSTLYIAAQQRVPESVSGRISRSSI